MTTKMLINSTRADQLRVAVVDGTILQEYQTEIAEAGLTRGNIYRGVVANIQPSLNAAFIDLGEERHGFLPVADVQPTAYHKEPPKNVKRPKIDQVLEKGKAILVQVTKDGVGQKGPALNTNLAIAGRYLVLTPFDGVRGISRKAQDDDARKKIKDRLKKLNLPDGHGTIVRTNGLDQNQATLNRDLNALLRLWKKISTEADRGRGPKLVYSDQDLVVQAMRDYLDPGIAEVIVDDDDVHAKAEAYMKAFMPRSKTRLVRYEDRLPLFSRYRLETQIDRIYERSTSLPSGGTIVIDQTEALTAIDVNSSRATKTANHDDSIFKVNCEAAEEVARQLRLRDIGGLVVIDFIDMRLRRHQSKLEKVMRDAMKIDKARWSVGRISSNGLLEINRQRIKQALRLRTHRACPTCDGLGSTPTPEFAALRLLSRIEGRAASGLMQSVTVALHPEIADALQNRFRRHLASVEEEYGVTIEVIAAANLTRTEERIEWVQREGGQGHSPHAKTAAVGAADLTLTARRRRRRRGAADEEPDAAEEPTTSRSSDAEESEEAPRGRRRRRRRGRRRGGDASDERDRAQQVAESTEAEDGRVEAEGGAADEAQDADSEATTGRRGRRRRRRRRGRGGRSDEAAQTAQDAATPPSAEAEAEAPPAESGDDDEKPRRRRRRRRRRGSRANVDAIETTADDSGDDAEAPHHEAAEAVEQPMAVAVGAENDPVPGAAAPDDGEPTDADPTPTRRRRRRRRRGARGETAPDVTATSEDAQVEQAPAEPAPRTPSDEDTAKPARRRRSRTRRSSRSKNTTADQHNTSVYDERQPETNESALHHSAASTDAAPVPPPVGVLAGQPERSLSQRLRWQWWGGPSDQPPGSPVETFATEAQSPSTHAHSELEPAAETNSQDAPGSHTGTPGASIPWASETTDDAEE